MSLWSNASVRITLVRVERKEKAKREARAKAFDNGGEWFVARSRHNVKDLEKQFRLRRAAGILEEHIGGILGSPEFWEKHRYVYIQVERDLPKEVRDMLLVCLEEMGVKLVGRVARVQMTNV